MMEDTVLPSGTQLSRRIGLVAAVVCVSGAAVMFTFIAFLLDLDSSEWTTFAITMSVLGGVAGIACEYWRHGALQPIVNWLDTVESGDISDESTLDVFEAVISLPSRFQRVVSIIWLFVGIMGPLVLSLVGSAAWGFGLESMVVITAGLCGAMLSYSLLFFGMKRELELVRVEIAGRIPNAQDRSNRIQPISIARKVSMSMMGTVATVVLFAILVSYTRAIASHDHDALKWQSKAVAVLAERLEALAQLEADELGEDEISVEETIASMFIDADLLPYPTNFEVIDAALAERSTTDANSVRLEILKRVEAGEAKGSSARQYQNTLWSWHELSDGRIAAASIRREHLAVSYHGIEIGLAVILALSIGFAWFIAAIISEDILRAITVLRSSAERMASGDLKQGRVYESEDELGDLSRSFGAMGGALRTTVKSLAAAADRVDSAAGQIATVADGVATASADQVKRIQQASELMVSINTQVMEVAGSAQDLNTSVEESSSSILELGAAGDELNETASVLGNKVDEVSSSIEQMVRSVKQVGSSSDGLSDAAAETSASMEEMASAMRAVDTTAEMTAGLSRQVVGAAESGQKKVSQTIEGMQAISDATNSAERVIRGLGSRTKEIGAILDVIDDVADETNLLALNAAIIAAQAGEHGRAFSVVADEIKELADRVLASTKEIGGLIRSVQDESTNAIGAIEEGTASVASGVELSAEAGLSLEEITRSSRESGQHIGEIVLAVREQTKAASHVVSLMDRVRDGVEQIGSASAEQDRGNEVVYRSSVTMREVAQQVRRTTEEQSRGFSRIRESVEGVREAVENINGSLQEQSTACGQVTEFLEQVYERTRSNEDAAKSMGDAIRSMVNQAELLREDVAKFQV